MDLSRPVGYRLLALNDVALDPASGKLVGNELQRVEWQPVVGVGYKEKRALADGSDASDVYLGNRTLILSGITHGATKGDLFDRLQAVKVAFTPTAAYADDPGAKGYLPLDFYVPTENTEWVGERHVMLNARPLGQPGIVYDRDHINPDPAAGMSQDWIAQVEAIDPRVYGYSPWNHDIAVGATPSHGPADLENRGDYDAPLKIMLVVAANAPASSSFHFEGGGTNLDIAIPSIAYSQVFRYDSALKVLTVEVNSVESFRMDLLTFNNKTTHPLIQQGVSSFAYVFINATTLAGGHIWFYEAWA